MPIRKNTKRIDPRYFLHEKTELLKESLVDAIIQIIKDSPFDDMDNAELHYAIGEKFPQLSDDQIDAAMNNKKLDPYYNSLEGVYSKNPESEKPIDLHGFSSEKETADFVKKNPSFFNEELRDYVRGQSRSPDVEVPGGGVRSVKGVKSSIMDSLEDAIQAAQRGDFETVATRVANLEAFVKALKKVGEIK